MRHVLLIAVVASLSLVPRMAAQSTRVHFVTFPKSEAEVLGQIDKLNATVDCSWIAALKSVPELYNIEVGYEAPTQNSLEARPRIGAAAVTLSHWSGVIGVRVPTDADAKSCFAVTVTVVGRSGTSRTWKGKQLGFSE